jgi:hypothetical protein
MRLGLLINCNDHATCSYYVNVHLDWGIKGNNVDANPCDDGLIDRYDVGTQEVDGGFNAEVNGQPFVVGLRTCRTFTFSHEYDFTVSSDSVQNLNAFKKIAGVIGTVNSSISGEAISALPLVLTNNAGEIVQEGETDEDGFYTLIYTHRGKPALYTVIPGIQFCNDGEAAQEQMIELQSNGWVEVSFDTFTCEVNIEYGTGRNKNK